jgi:hypothetical protein
MGGYIALIAAHINYNRIVPMTFSCLVKTEGNRVPTWLSCSQIGLKYASGISIFFKCTSTSIIIGGTFY